MQVKAQTHLFCVFTLTRELSTMAFFFIASAWFPPDEVEDVDRGTKLVTFAKSFIFTANISLYNVNMTHMVSASY